MVPCTESELIRAIRDEEFRLVYQPLVDAHSRRVEGAEALIRWQHPRRGYLAPDSFLPDLERRHLMSALTDWTVDRALRQCAEWRAQGALIPVSVNLSATLLGNQLIVERVIDALERYDTAPQMLTLEVTETALAHSQAAAAIFARLRDVGVRISLDDFGTGYTSLASLKDHVIDEIKIDRSFVAPMRHSPTDAAIVRSVLELGHRLATRVVAEGVEDAITAGMLQELGCDVLQGYFFAKPDTGRAIVELTRASDRRASTASARTGPRPYRPAPIPHNEDKRLQALAELQILDAPPDPVLDDLVELASQICGSKMAALTLIDRDRAWFGAQYNMGGPDGGDRDLAFCSHAILDPEEIFEVADASRDPRFATHPAVIGDGLVRSYAGAPLVTKDGYAIGALCVVDDTPRQLTEDQRIALKRLSRVAMRHLEAHKSDAIMHRLRGLARALATMGSLDDLSDAATAVAATARAIMGAAGATVLLPQQAGAVAYHVAGMSLRDPANSAKIASAVVDVRTSALAKCVQTGEPVFMADVAASSMPAHVRELFGISSALQLPMRDGATVMGIVAVWWTTRQDALPPSMLTAANLMADEASIGLSRLHTRAALRNATETDDLTGLLNRPAFISAAKNLPIRSGVVYVDIDHFRRIIELRGPQGTDLLIKSFAAHLRAAVRTDDIVARWGSDDFVIALPGGGVDGARQLMRRLRESWTDTSVTFSSSHTELNPRESAVTALSHAESALRLSKSAGEGRDIFVDAFARSSARQFVTPLDATTATTEATGS